MSKTKEAHLYVLKMLLVQGEISHLNTTVNLPRVKLTPCRALNIDGGGGGGRERLRGEADISFKNVACQSGAK